MSETLDPKKLDLIGVLSGRDYPELEVPVYFNEKLGFEIHQLQKKIAEVEARGDSKTLEALDAERDKLVNQAESEKFVVTLQGIPEKVYRSIVDQVNEEHPNETDLFGREKSNPKGDELFTKKLWQAYIRTVTAPDGAQNHVGEAEVDALIAQAPSPAQEAITRGITELRTGSKSGFEYAVKELDFLSSASPEG